MQPFDPLKHMHEGAVGFSADGSLVPLQVATKLEIGEVRAGSASIIVTRYFRSFTPLMAAAATILAPTGAMIERLLVRMSDSVFVARRDQGETAALNDGEISVAHREPLHGLHVVEFDWIVSHREVEVVAEISAPLSFAETRPHLKIPASAWEVFARMEQAPPASERRLTTAVVIVSPEAGVTLLDGRLLVEGPNIVRADGAIKLEFPQARASYEKNLWRK